MLIFNKGSKLNDLGNVIIEKSGTCPDLFVYRLFLSNSPPKLSQLRKIITSNKKKNSNESSIPLTSSSLLLSLSPPNKSPLTVTPPSNLSKKSSYYSLCEVVKSVIYYFYLFVNCLGEYVVLYSLQLQLLDHLFLFQKSRYPFHL